MTKHSKLHIYLISAAIRCVHNTLCGKLPPVIWLNCDKHVIECKRCRVIHIMGAFNVTYTVY